MKHFDLNTYLERNLELKNSETGNFDYKCLKYDDYGGVFLEVRGENIDQNRWNRPIRIPKSVQFDALQNLSNYLINKGIKFVFIQCPIKLRAESIETDKIIINNYIKKVKEIIENHNNLFLDYYSEMKFSEQDFCDTYHLNREASEKFTRKVFDFLKQSDYLK